MTYQLSLPATWQIHLVFHASLFSPYHKTKAHGPNYSRPPPDLIDREEFFEVEQIHNHQHHGQSRMLQYLIKWKGSLESDNTWEPADLVLTPDLLKQYHKDQPLSRIKANQLTLQHSHCLSWPPQNQQASSVPSSGLHPTPPTNFTNFTHAPADTKTSLTPLPTAANHTSPTSTPSYTLSSVKNPTVAIIPEDHLLCQPWVCLVKDFLPCLHPLHPCPFQCALHPLNRTGATSPATLAFGAMIPFKSAKSLKTSQNCYCHHQLLGLPPLSHLCAECPCSHPQSIPGPILVHH